MLDLQELLNNIASNSTHYRLEHPSNFVLVPAVITILFGATADILIISTILKSRRWTSIFSFYILNWCICDAMLLLLQPITYTAIFSVNYVTHKVAMCWLGSIVAITIGNYLFVAALTMDWLYSNFFEACAEKVRRFNRYQTSAIWLIVVILVIYVCNVSILEKTSLWIFAITTISLIMYCIVQILWFIKRKTSSGDSEQSNLALAMVSVYFICWIPNYLIQGIKAFEDYRYVADESNVVTCLVGYLNSLIMLTLLYYGDDHFNASFGTLCSGKSKANNVVPENIEAK